MPVGARDGRWRCAVCPRQRRIGSVLQEQLHERRISIGCGTNERGLPGKGAPATCGRLTVLVVGPLVPVVDSGAPPQEERDERGIPVQGGTRRWPPARPCCLLARRSTWSHQGYCSHRRPRPATPWRHRRCWGPSYTATPFCPRHLGHRHGHPPAAKQKLGGGDRIRAWMARLPHGHPD